MSDIYIRISSLNESLPKFREISEYNKSLFMEPWIANSWANVFGRTNRNLAMVGFIDDKVVGYMPIRVNTSTDTCYFTGDKEVFDYADFVTIPGYEEDFFKAAISHIKEFEGAESLVLETIRPDSNTYKVAEKLGIGSFEVSDVSYEMKLPATFEEYLNSLDHSELTEINRKIRNIEELGKPEFLVKCDREITESDVNLFIKMMVESRKDKADFMTSSMEIYFKNLIKAASEIGIARLGILKIGDASLAMVLCFEYNNVLHLYNSGFDPLYINYSAGLLSKIYSIKYAVENKKHLYDFLKGSESYKARLGGEKVELYRLTLN